MPFFVTKFRQISVKIALRTSLHDSSIDIVPRYPMSVDSKVESAFQKHDVL